MEKVISNFHPYSILLYLASMQNTSWGKLFFLISLGKVCRVRKLRNVIYEMLRAWLKKKKKKKYLYQNERQAYSVWRYRKQVHRDGQIPEFFVTIGKRLKRRWRDPTKQASRRTRNFTQRGSLGSSLLAWLFRQMKLYIRNNARSCLSSARRILSRVSSNTSVLLNFFSYFIKRS